MNKKIEKVLVQISPDLLSTLRIESGQTLSECSLGLLPETGP